MSDKNWKNDAIQFPRLLAEINACGLTGDQEQAIAESMDISGDELTELFDRAEAAWDKVKDEP